MLFMAYVNDGNTDVYTTGYDPDGQKQLTRMFCTVAVEQYRPLAVELKQNFKVNNIDKSLCFRDFNLRSRVHGRCGSYFDTQVPAPILDSISIAYQSGLIPKTHIVDLRVENCDKIKEEYEEKVGLFSFRRKLENAIV